MCCYLPSWMCMCKDCMICMSLHGEPESHSGMLIARLMMAPCPALPGRKDVDYGSVAVRSFHASWEAYCGDFICVAVCQQKGGPLLPLAPLPVCLSLSLAFTLQTPTAMLLIIPAAPLATSKWPIQRPLRWQLASYSFRMIKSQRNTSLPLVPSHILSLNIQSAAVLMKREKKIKGDSTLQLF